MKAATDDKGRKEWNLRRTPQRDAILRYLENNHRHPSAGDIFDAVRDDIPGMSVATVYNTLERLREAGEIRELTLDPRRRRFDPRPTLHHHVVCIRCGEIRDVSGEVGMGEPTSGFDGYKIIEAQIEFFGICPECQERG